jgi:(2Fe-2S) ferredoxin
VLFYICFSKIVPWCNWLTRLTLDQKSLGSSPSGTAYQSIPARSSSGLGRRPLKAEITGSNPVRATKTGEQFCSPFIFKFPFKMKRYDKHIFICENKRPETDPRGCCADKNSLAVRELFKNRIKQLGLNINVRANAAGCLDACEHGATIVIYPEQIWYGNVTIEDVEEILQEHIIKNIPVDRLKIKDEKFNRDEPKI